MTWKQIWMALALAMAPAAGLKAADSAVLVAEPGSKLWLAGDSTLHAFASTATLLDVSASLEPAIAKQGLSAAALESAVNKGGVKSLDVVVPVEGMKSGEKGLDRNMYRALKSDPNKEIRFHLESYEVAAASGPAPETVKAKGRLSIAGKEQPVELRAEIRFTGKGLEVAGTQDILMTDYGVTPPKLMFGAIKVKNKVVIHYDLLLAPKSSALKQ